MTVFHKCVSVAATNGRVHCAHCDRWILSYDYAVHQRRHNNVRPHVCEVSGCNKACFTPYELQTHVSAVHDQQRPFKCDRCDKRFGQKAHLRSHIKFVHDKVKPHRCPYCTYKCTSATTVRAHCMSLHKHEPVPSLIKRLFVCSVTAFVYNSATDIKCLPGTTFV